MTKRKKKPTSWWRGGVFHIETPLGIINIRPSLRDSEDNPVDSISIIPDDGVVVDPQVSNVRLIKR